MSKLFRTFEDQKLHVRSSSLLFYGECGAICNWETFQILASLLNLLNLKKLMMSKSGANFLLSWPNCQDTRLLRQTLWVQVDLPTCRWNSFSRKLVIMNIGTSLELKTESNLKKISPHYTSDRINTLGLSEINFHLHKFIIQFPDVTIHYDLCH